MNELTGEIGRQPNAARRWNAGTVLLVGLTLIAGANGLPAAGVAEPVVNLKRHFVPENRPELWPKGDWQPIARDDLQKLLDDAQPPRPGPRAARIVRGEYTATLAGETLKGGLLTLNVSRTSDDDELLPLDPLDVAISSLAWTDGQPPVWGTAPDGRTFLRVDRDQGELRGAWSLRGRRFTQHLEFELKLAPASVSRVVLQIPTDRRLTASVGNLRGPFPGDDPGLAKWRIDLGSETQCRIRVHPVRNDDVVRPLVLYERDAAYAVSEAGLQLQFDIHLEVFGAPIKDLVFELPESIEVRSLAYGDEPLHSWSSLTTKQPGRKRLRVRLPDPILGPSRTLQLTGFGSIEFDRMFTLPSLKLLNGIFSAGGTTTLRVDNPLEFRQFEAPSHRQLNPLAVSSQGQTLTLQPYADQAELRADIGYPQMAVSATVTEYAELNSNSWSLVAEIDWRASSGSVFAAQCRLPPDWELTDVRAPLETGTSALSNWKVLESSSGVRELVVEFKDALTPENPQSVLIFGQRPSPGRDNPVNLPVVHPLDCIDSDVLLVLAHPAPDAVVLDYEEGFESIDPENVPPLRQESRLWQRIQDDLEIRDDIGAVFLHSNAKDANGTLRLPNAATAFTASSAVHVQLDDGRLHERYEITCVPRDDVLDRILVYLTTSGAPLAWEFKQPTIEEPIVQRLPLARHAEMGLPDTGELWELRIPTPQTGTIRLAAQRESQFPLVSSPALAYVPRAAEFRGEVTLTIPESLEITVEQLEESGTADSGDDAEAVESSTAKMRQQRWTYTSATAGLLLRWPQVASTNTIVPLASASLRSRLASPRESHDSHTLSLRLDPHTDSDTFSFRLPSPAELVRVTVNGQEVIPSREAADFQVPIHPGDAPSRVELEYRIPVDRKFLTDHRRVVLPQIRETVLQFEWNAATPPQAFWNEFPASLSLQSPRHREHWSQRIFGPLGRSEGPIFNPLRLASWADLFATSPSVVETSSQRSTRSWVPPGWSTVTLRGADLPQPFDLTVWNSQRLCALEWVALLSCALVGLLVRRRQFSWCMPLAIWSSGLFLISAVLAPAAPAGIAGGAFLGSILAILFPRNWLTRLPLGASPEEGLSFGSTATIQNASFGLLLTFAALTALHASAQERNVHEPAAASPRRENDSNSDDSDSEEFPILVPVDAELQPSQRIPVVYVTQELIDRLESLSRPPAEDPKYLISTADYRGYIDAQETVTLRATLTIAVLAKSPDVEIYLPISNANLATPEDCLVDGVPHPVASADDQPGLVLRLPGASSGTVEEFSVSLTLHPSSSSISGGASFQCAIPALHQSRLAMEFHRPVPSITITDARGTVETLPSDTSAAASLGRTSQLQLRWLWKLKKPDPVQWSARVACLVELHPTRVQYHYHVVYDVQRGRVDHVRWRLPPRVVIRSVQTEGQRPFSFFANNVDDSELLIEFDEPKTSSFSVDVVFTLPTRMENNRMTLPPIDVLAGAVPVTNSHLGLATTREFRLESAIEGADQLQSISVDEFTRNWTEVEFLRKPEKAYRLTGSELSGFPEVSFPLIPLAPERRVREIQEGRITPNRLLWTFSAEVTTSTAPAFQHTLVCDSQLKIDSISVQENEAERLVHWSQIDEHLVLYLGHRTTGIQNVVIEGSLPLARMTETKLPRIRFEHAELVDSQLGLFHDPTLNVELVGDEALTPAEVGGDSPPTGSRHIFQGRFTIPSDVASPRIRVSRRDAAAQFGSLTMLSRESDDLWNLATILRVQTAEEQLRPVELHIPTSIASTYQLDAPETEQHHEALPDGSQRLILEPSSPKTRTLIVKLTAPLKPEEERWEIPRIRVANASSREHFLLLAPSELFEPAADSNAAPASLPAWILHTGHFEMPSGEVEVFRNAELSWVLEPQGADRSPETASVPLLATKVWMESDGRRVGETDAFIVSPPHAEVTFACPPGIKSRALLVNGQPEAHTLSDDGRLMLSLSGETTHAVRFFWTLPAGEDSGWGRRFRAEFPQPVGVPVEHAVTAAYPHSDAILVGADKSVAREPATMDALQGLIAFHQAGLDHGERLRQDTWDLLVLQADAMGIVPRVQAADGKESGDEENLDRLRQTLADLQSRIQEANFDSTPTFLSPSTYATGRQAELFSVKPTEKTEARPASHLVVSGWMIRSNLLRLIGGGLAGFLGLLILHRLFTPKSVDWLKSRPAYDGLLFGLLWWLFLSASVAGFALLTASVLAVVWRPLYRWLKPAAARQ